MRAPTLLDRLDHERRSDELAALVSLSPTEVAHVLAVSRSTVDRLIGRGDLASFRAGRRARRVRVADLAAFIEEAGEM